MSWDAYIDAMETGKGKVTYGAVIGHDPPPVTIWAQSKCTDKLPLTVAEIAQVIQAIKCQDQSIFANGVKIAKQAFTVLLLEPNLLILQGKGENKHQCMAIALTGKACIVGYNDQAEVKVPSVREGVQSLQDYLTSVGY